MFVIETANNYNLIKKMAEIFEDILGLQQKELEEITSFAELGVGSINAVKLVEAINTKFNLNLPTSIIFECNNLYALSGYVDSHMLKNPENLENDIALPNVELQNDVPQNRPQMDMQINYQSSDPAIIKKLAEIFEDILGLQRTELEEIASFTELGVGSINAVKLVEAINTNFNLHLPTSIIFECNNLDSLAKFIENHMPDSQEEQNILEDHNTELPDEVSQGYCDTNQVHVDIQMKPQIINNEEPKRPDDIAIIGLSCRCAGANGQEEFWDLVSQGKECIEEIKDKNWLEFYKRYSAQKMPNRHGIMSDIEYFDPLFFRISPQEAEAMDVQQRIILEECYKALEDAGYDPSLLRGQPVGTFIGSVSLISVVPNLDDFSMLGTETSVLASRIAYFLDLKGPALAINTACSSSLVAIDIACQKLKNHDINLAIAGGITIFTQPVASVSMNKAGILSPAGQCRPFDNEANGIVIGDGSGVVILKRLQEAQRDNDNIYGIIRGSGTNQNGQTSGITVPSFLAQSQLEESVYRKNQICVDDIQYIEAHGTATKLGDPVEVHALNHTFRKFTHKKHYCAIGSLKANIGHTAAAAGVLSLIKVLLCLKYKQLPPSINFNKENEHIDFEDSPFFVSTALKEWPTNSKSSRLTAVSSFGISGTNTHLVVEEYTQQERTKTDITNKKPAIIVLSAKKEAQLQDKVRQLLSAIQKRQLSDSILADMAYTLQVGREAMEERLGFIVGSVKELEEKLKCFLENQDSIANVYRGQVKRNKETVGIFAADEELQEAIDKWVKRGKYGKLLELWVKGLNFDWHKLYASAKLQRISLPTYPFAKDRYRILKLEFKSISEVMVTPTIADAVHPLLQETLSTVIESNFSGISDKPTGISLKYLSNDPILSNKPISPIQQLSTLPSTMLSQPINNYELKPGSNIRVTVSIESLHEELITSLAEALYMERNDIDVDKKFIDMGLDSIIGVEWIKTINKLYGSSIPVTKVYDYPSIREFAKFLRGKVTLTSDIPHSRTLEAAGTSFEETEKRSANNEKAVPEQTLEIYSAGVSEEPHSIMRPSNRFLDFIHPTDEGLVQTTGAIRGEGCSETADCKEGIAIVGISGKYPDASNLDQYWDNLMCAKNSIREIPKNRWDWKQYYDSNPSEIGKIYCKWIGALEDIEYFDPLFFQISPSEAEFMDPQHRIFLQEGYRAFEDAGYNQQSLSNKKCGVYLGIMGNEYAKMLYKNQVGFTNTTGNSFAIAAARIPYFLNLKGPAIPIDTACSSSLVATHLACQSLLNHEIDMALVGGVGLYLAPEAYIGMCAAGMLSPYGQCKTFDNSADGFVPGEGAGVMVLKRLKDAESDKDHIYGVIIGSGINQDGKTNGITAPSVNSQIELEREIYDKYEIDPESISYVEMHGTGTKLGDPIELEALSTVFKERTKRKKYCAIGSVKTNIGHTSAAAGVASVHKVLLCLKYKKLVPTLNFKKLNEHIDLEDSPFYVNTKLQPWEAASGTPRRACVSAFGFSGTNAHVVIEEYLPKTNTAGTQIQVNPNNRVLFVLSAKSEEQLKIYAKCIKSYIELHKDLNLADMAYTLQIGREGMDFRLAFLADAREGVLQALEAFSGNGAAVGVITGQVKMNKDGVASFEDDEDLSSLIVSWVQKKKLKKVAELWTKGLNIEWDQLYGEVKPRRISLPTYPFSKEYYWIPRIDIGYGNSSKTEIFTAVNAIHPLLHKNTSDIYEQRFSSTFTGKEFFLSEHVVEGQRVLPGVVCLEMAQEAVAQAVGTAKEGKTGIRIENVVWVRPITIADQPLQVNIGIYPEDNGEISYEIYSGSAADHAEKLVHNQGRAVLSSLSEVESLDIKAIQRQCSHSTLSSAECYEAFKTMSIKYGPGLRGIEEVYIGQGQVLTKLSLPSSVADTLEQFVLHPSLMDSALQSSIGLIWDNGNFVLADSTTPHKPVLPFALEQLEIFEKCIPRMWSFIRYSDGRKATDKVQKLDIDLCDENGTVFVRMKGFSSRVIESEVGPEETKANQGVLMFTPCWNEQAVAVEAKAPVCAQHLIVFCEPDEIPVEDIAVQISGARCLILKAQRNEIEERFKTYAVQVFEEIQNILKDKPQNQVLVQIIVPMQNDKQLFSGLGGLLKTARLENPKLIGQLIEVEDYQDIIEKIKENRQSPLNDQIRYQNGKRLVASLSEFEGSANLGQIPWKEHGVYLITGGAGGLGLLFAQEIVDKVKNVTLILTGRSLLKKETEAKIKHLHELGARIIYKQVDVTHKEAVRDLIQNICEEYGRLQGIIHSAGVIHDNFILKKNAEEIEKVLGPKVAGLVNLDEASKELCLDFLIVFSSVAGAMGNPGQADYSSANAFMDTYVQYRNKLVRSKHRQGQTLAINWPLWKEGGMRVDEETERLINNTAGITAMETSSGIQAFYQSIISGKEQVLVMKGDAGKYRTAYLQQTDPEDTRPSASKEESKPALVIDQSVFQEKTINYFKKLLSLVIKLPADRIEAETPMDRYGIDSIMVMQLTNQLEKIFGSLSKTLFFEYPNIRELSQYFIESYREQLLGLLGIVGNSADAAGNAQTAIVLAEPDKMSIRNRRRQRLAPIQPERREEKTTEIAVIGVAGRYPGAANIQEFWRNLCRGKDCITEIPQDRWNHSLYFDENKEHPGKTYCKWGGFLEGVDQFDPLFFNISPREAEIMDPQERLFLETTWSLFESIGYTRHILQQQYQGKVGVYVGAMYQQYHAFNADIMKESIVSLSSYSSIANRVSYFFNFQGPSIAIDTACSSSLTAIHMACEDLIKGNCYLAIAGGVNLSIHPKKYIGLSQAQLLGSHINSRSFGDGDGYLPAEGIGAVLLKPLARAIQDRDSILAVIKSTAINHCGWSNGYAVPNPNTQAKLIEDNFAKSGIDPRTISYVESAANGSALGDPIEVTALTKAFGNFTTDKQFCAIGSVKSNIGNAEAASGISQLSKVVLQLRHKQLVPSIKAIPLNPNLDFSNTPFYLQQQLQEWKRPVVSIHGKECEIPLRATVSSFGVGGSNVHLILEEHTPLQEDIKRSCFDNSPQLIILSAKNQERLLAVIERMLEFIKLQEELSLADIAYTLQVGREAMEVRVAMVVKNLDELVQGLTDYLKSIKEATVVTTSLPVFTGNLDEDYSEIKELIFGKAGDTMLKVLLAENNLEKLAVYWVKGGNIPWEIFNQGKGGKIILLPTYAFAKERYWVSANEVDHRDTQSQQFSEKITELTTGPKKLIQEDIKTYIVQFLSQELALDQHKIKLHTNIQDYGVGSIIGMKFRHAFEKTFHIRITGREMLEHPTISFLSTYLAQKIEALDTRENEQAKEKYYEERRQGSEFKDDQGIKALEAFKQGRLTLDEMQNIIRQGVVI